MYWHKKLSSDWPLNKIGDETKCSEVFCKYTKKKLKFYLYQKSALINWYVIKKLPTNIDEKQAGSFQINIKHKDLAIDDYPLIIPSDLIVLFC